MSKLTETVDELAEKLEGIIDRVCSACGNSCCHQGTMMGSQDLLRLHKGMLLEAGREQIVRAGLRRRSAELRVDLAALEQTAGQLAEALPDSQHPELDRLARHLAGWREFCDFLESDFALNRENLRFLLRFSGIRANALRVVQRLPEGRDRLADVAASSGASFRLTRARIAPHRCLFHVDGCLAGSWKPVKCASFFCTTEPNVLAEIGKDMTFEAFVLANFRAATEEQVLRAIELELELGREYIAPKIVVGSSDELVSKVEAALKAEFKFAEVRREETPFMLSSREAYALLDNLPDYMAYVRTSRSVDGGALYELAVALDWLRIAGKPMPFYLFAAALSPPTALTHPLWADGTMSQPLGGLELYALE